MQLLGTLVPLTINTTGTGKEEGRRGIMGRNEPWASVALRAVSPTSCARATAHRQSEPLVLWAITLNKIIINTSTL